MNKIKLTALALSCCLPLLASNSFADDKMAPKMSGKMEHKMAPKMESKMAPKMMGNKMSPHKKMSASEHKTYMGMSKTEKALFDKYADKM